MKKALLLLLFCAGFYRGSTQDLPTAQAEMDNLYEFVDMAEVTSGILINKTLVISGIQKYDGQYDTTASVNNWRQIYYELYNASLNKEAILPLTQVRTSLEEYLPDRVPVAILNYAYHRIDTAAFANQQLTVDTTAHKIYDVPGRSGSPYLLQQAFAVSTATAFLPNRNVIFFIDESFYFTNITDPVNNLEVDFGDGAGYRSVSLGNEISITYQPQDTLVTLSLRLEQNGQTLTGTTTFGFAKSNNYPLPDHIIHNLTGSWQRYDGIQVLAGGQAYVKYGNGTVPSGAYRFCKPLIFVEGIDFGTGDYKDDNPSGYRKGDFGWPEVYGANQKEYDMLKNLPELREELLLAGYDLILLDFNDGATDIQANAMVLVDLINKVKALTNPICGSNGSGNELVVMGASMGGQVARFGLAWMEKNNQPHCTRLYISFDSPHTGANVPIGFQYLIQYMSPTFQDIDYSRRKELDREASMQMMRRHHAFAAPGFRNAWVQDQATYGYPERLRKIAITNGSISGSGLGFSSGDQLVRLSLLGKQRFYHYNILPFGPLALYATLIWTDVQSWAIAGANTNGKENVVFKGRRGFLTSTAFAQVASTAPLLDNAPGGYRSSMKSLQDKSFGIFNALEDDHCFIPVVSALGIKNNPALTYNVSQNIPIRDLPAPTIHPFDAIYAPPGNEPHLQITNGDPLKFGGSDNIEFILKQLLNTENNLPGTLANASHNFGSTLRNRLGSVIINAGGNLYVNRDNIPVTGSNPAMNPGPGNFDLITGTCGAYVQVNGQGNFELGGTNAATHQAAVFFKSGSTLDLNGGKLVINDNSRLVIEEGAFLNINPNAVIELNGDNAILEIRGKLIINPGATFTFTAKPGVPTGFVRLNFSGSIAVAPTSRIIFQGQGMSDKILELAPQAFINYSDWDIAEYTIENGLVEMKSDSRLILGHGIKVNNVHFTGNGSYYAAVECNDTGEKITNSKFTNGQTGLQMNLFAGQQATLTNNDFNLCTTGLRGITGNLLVKDCSFTNNATGWRMAAGGACESLNSNFIGNIDYGIDYHSAAGTLGLNSSNINTGLTGVLFDGSGSLTGSCTQITENTIGAELKNQGFADFSATSTTVPRMRFFNSRHNIFFDLGNGLNFQDGENIFYCEDLDGVYNTIGTTRGTSGIFGEIASGALNTNNDPLEFTADKNNWNLEPIPTEPEPGIINTTLPFDYRLYTNVGSGKSNYIEHKIVDDFPIARPTPQQQILHCPVEETGGGGARLAFNNQPVNSGTSTNINSKSGNSCNQSFGLQQAIQQASGKRKRNNRNGNDYQAFRGIQTAINALQPDTCREFNQLVDEAYRLLRETYTASLASDTSAGLKTKLTAINQVTDKFMNWKQQRGDTSGYYYLWMDKALNGYAAGDLFQARSAISQAQHYATPENDKYVRYWDCLVTASQDLRDSVITTADFFQQLDNCTLNNATSRIAAKTAAPKSPEANLLKLYPNPTNDQVKISYFLIKAEPVTIDLVDLNGVVLQTLRKPEAAAGQQEESITVNRLKSGLYFIRVYGKLHNQAARLSVLK